MPRLGMVHVAIPALLTAVAMHVASGVVMVRFVLL
jgi:hypothetical protein